MANLPPDHEPNRDLANEPTPHWVKVFAIIAAIVIVAIVVLHLTVTHRVTGCDDDDTTSP